MRAVGALLERMGTLVGDLLLPCRPAHLAAASVAMVVPVTARRVFINRQITGRLLTHIGKKLGEVISPVLADCDTSSAVIFPRSKAFISATPDHPRPCFVQRMVQAFSSIPMPEIAISIGAATTPSTAGLQAVADCVRVFATVAEASPEDFAVETADIFDDGQPSEALANKVNLGCHREPTFPVSTPRDVSRIAAALSYPHFTTNVLLRAA